MNNMDEATKLYFKYKDLSETKLKELYENYKQQLLNCQTDNDKLLKVKMNLSAIGNILIKKQFKL